MLFLVFFSLLATAFAENYFEVEFQPGHEKDEYYRVEEVKVGNETTTDKPVEDEHLIAEAILDVAYYVRRFKFSGYDLRYMSAGESPKKNFFIEFPSPPLRTIHWEVRKNCEESFVDCVKYLQEQVSQMLLPRHLDSLTIAMHNQWDNVKHLSLIKQADIECQKLLEKDESTFNLFSGPLEKFQWMASAMYYMCLFTMREVSYLRNFEDNCDNFAACIDWNFGMNNNDPRADKNEPFACSLYSFCPDPCCPLKHISDFSKCMDSSPCAPHSPKDKTCHFEQKQNADFESMQMNQWNISCECDAPGTKWESKSGMCVDIDECLESESPCNYPSETCMNLQGSFRCVCSPMGYRNNSKTKVCERDPTVQHIINPPTVTEKPKSKNLSDKFHKIINKFKSVMSVNLVGNEAEPNKTEESNITTVEIV